MSNKILPLYAAALLLIASACSTTSAIPDGEQLFTGLKKIEYTNYEKNEHATATQEEMEYALASAPNGALFGSSYYRTPFQFKLWIWNAFSQSKSKLGQWISKTFGSKPKLLSQVNPDLRASVAESQLMKYGYFHGKVTHKEITGSNPKKAKIAYTVNMGPLWTIDSLQYNNFPPEADSLIKAHEKEKLLHNGDPFSVPVLDNERQRISSLFRDNGYYFYKSGNASYLADTLNVPGKVLLRLQLADSLPSESLHKWYIGNVKINFRREFLDTLRDSTRHRSFTAYYNGKRSPLRTGVILRGLGLRHGQLYSGTDEQESSTNLQNTGLFSYTNLRFTRRDTTANCDTLDLDVDLVFDKPYDFYIEANAKGKTSGRVGPELVLGMTKRNAFRGGENLDINLHGSYEWQTGHNAEGSSSGVNSYEYGGDISLIMPRLVTPYSLFHKRQRRDGTVRRRRHRYYGTPTTTLKASMNIMNRAGYFRRHVISGELTYDFSTSARTHHTFSPLSLSYQFMNNQTDAFQELLDQNPYLSVSMRDQFVPKMSYTYSYSTTSTSNNPITVSATVSEAGNILSLGYMIGGYKWGEKNKRMFKNPYAQFLKLEVDFVKQWSLSEHSRLVGHLNTGAVWSYGNATQSPYYEQFYVGGANSVRAFNVRSIGPGKYFPSNSKMSYVEQVGDVKFLANLEYRPHLFGSLYGAVFLDAGNVWSMHEDSSRPGSKFEFKNFFKQLAVGTGIGLRYDMDIFVIRLDWGIGLHVPYDNGKSGFYNISSFRDGQSIHLAVGYPF